MLLEIGCADAFGTRLVVQEVKRLTATGLRSGLRGGRVCGAWTTMEIRMPANTIISRPFSTVRSMRLRA
jgi:hypothetical protein